MQSAAKYLCQGLGNALALLSFKNQSTSSEIAPKIAGCPALCSTCMNSVERGIAANTTSRANSVTAQKRKISLIEERLNAAVMSGFLNVGG